MKAIPDLDFAARHINKPAVPPKPQIAMPISPAPAGANATSGGEQPLGKVQLAAQKLNNMEGTGSHRGSGEFCSLSAFEPQIRASD